MNTFDEKIIKSWFAFDKLDNIHIELCSYQNSLYKTITTRKMYRACIKFGLGYEFIAHEVDMFLAIKKAIKQYSEFIIRRDKEGEYIQLLKKNTLEGE